MKRIRALLVLVVLALGLAGCGGRGADQPEPATPSATESAAAEAPVGEHTIVAQLVKFQPTSLTVPAGTTVTWTNRETLPVDHTVTFGTPGSPSGVFDEELPQAGSVTYTFSDPGTYSFYCNIHRAMTGEIRVQ